MTLGADRPRHRPDHQSPGQQPEQCADRPVGAADHHFRPVAFTRTPAFRDHLFAGLPHHLRELVHLLAVAQDVVELAPGVAGAARGDVDVGPPMIEPGRPAEGDHEALDPDVQSPCGLRREGCERRDVDHATVVALGHAGQDRMHQFELAGRHHLEEAPDVGPREFERTLLQRVAGAVDQDVDLAAGGADLFEGRLRGGGFRVVGDDRQDVDAVPFSQFRAKCLEAILATRRYGEIETAFGTNEISYEKIHELSYVIGVLNEAMRLYPPFWMIDRVALGDDQVCDVKVTAGTTVVPYIYGVHKNENIWKDPDRFDPTRFLGKNKRHPFSHIPFGGGPRVCIGQNMAIMQMLFVIVAIVRRYDFALNPIREVHKQAMMILRPDGPINMSFFRTAKVS